ncbi:MAG: hypothetical protein PHR96_04010, partial [Clostridia bacterium]|nr:hypothetical protein [Clostridia bacterium]
MKKIKYLIVVLACLIMPFITYGCEQETELNFNQETIQIVMGDSYNPFDKLDNTNENIEQFVTFASSNNQIFYITPNKMLVGVNSGSAVLYVYYKNLEIGNCYVNVLDKYVQFDAPVNLTYDYQTKNLKWSNVYAQSGENVVLASSFTVEISINDGTATEYTASGNKYGPLTEAGSYKVRVKTNGGGIYLPSDYRKNNDEYVYTNFVLMAQPIDLSFDGETSTLSWDTNGNLEDTKYKVFVNSVNITGDGIQDNNIILDISTAGTYNAYVEAVGNAGSFPSTSAVLQLQRLEAPELSFNNGILSWTAENKASGYELVLRCGLEEWTYQTQENSYDLSGVVAGTYRVYVRALGDVELNSYAGEASEYQFNKLALAELAFDSETGVFNVANNNGKNIEIVFQDVINGAQTTKTSNDYIFDISDTKTYFVKARILASDASIEINGNFSTFFTLASDSEQQLTKIKNLSVLELFYNESASESYIGFTEIDENCNYSLLLNDETAVADFSENTYDLGLTADIFTTSGTYNFKLSINKNIQNGTVFIGKLSFLNVAKLTAPVSLGITDTSSFSNVSVEVKDTVNYDIVRQVSILVNEVNSNVLDLQQSVFNIDAKLLAKTSPDIVGDIKTYYTSGDFNTFEIRRLASVQNLSFDYSEKEFLWNDVLNAVSYQVYLDGVQSGLTETTNFASDLDKAYMLTVYALPQGWTAVENGQIGYIFSKGTDLNVYKSGSLTNLQLTKDEVNNKVIANWTAPTGVPTGADVFYDIYINDDLITTESITENSYNFDNSLFDTQGNYTITVKVVDKNNEYFEPTNNNINMILSKLAPVLQIEKVLNIISAINFDINKMTGIIFNETLSENNSFDISGLDNGDVLSLQVIYAGIFDATEGVYCLNSNASTFTIKKLNTPANLDLNDEIFSWTTLDDDYSGLYNFKYYTIINQIKSSEIATTNLQASVTSEEEYAFYVYESALTSWQTLNAGETGLLSSTAVSFNVSRENNVTNLIMQLTLEENVLITWNYSKIEDLNDNGNYAPEFVLQVKVGENLIEEYILSLAEAYSVENQNYFKVIDSSVFDSESDFTISLTVQSDMSLISDAREIIITKLNAVNFVKVNVDTLILYNTETNQISLDGAESVIISGDINATINDVNYDLSAIQSGQTYVINVFVSGILPEEILNNHYFLGSETTTFVLTKIENITPVLDAESNKIVWEQRLGADYYDIKIETFDSQFFYIENVTDNFINLSNSELISYIQQSGIYKIYVKAVVQAKTINSNPLLLPALTGYVGNDYSDFVNLEKFSQVQNILISANEGTQQEVTITWDNVTGAETYEIWSAGTPTGNGQLIGTVPASIGATSSFVSSTDFSQSGDYFIWIKAKGAGFVESDISNKKQIVRFEAINQFNISATSMLSWNQSEQTASGLLDFSYLLQLLDSNSQLVNAFGEAGQITTNSYNLNANEWLNNYDGGNFVLKILVQGNGSSLTANGITTLSSGFYSINAYKFVAPEILLSGKNLTINSADLATYSENIDFYLTIKKNGVTLVLNELYQGTYEIPNNWESGDYEISAYATAKTNNNNLLKSKIKTVIFNKLQAVSGLVAEAQDLNDLMQESIEITWSAVQNATVYDIFINGELVESFEPITVEETYNFITEDYMQQAGAYEVQVQARADGFISSDLSEMVTVIRLNPIVNVYADSQAKAYWSAVAQSSADYTYTLLLVNNSGVVVGTVNDITALQSEVFVNFVWINELASGNFSIRIIVKGNGSSDNVAETLTLSSSGLNVQMYKFVQPVISVIDDALTITTTDTGLYSSQLEIKYTISINGTPVGVEQVYLSPFALPIDWDAGTFAFTAYVTAVNDVNNFVKSNVANLSVNKLETATGLEASATTVDDYSQTSVTLSWAEVTNATSYAIYIDGQFAVNVVPNIVAGVCSFATGTIFSLAGTYEVQIQARADGFISSDLSEMVTVIRLNPIVNVYADSQAKAYWSAVA